MYDEIKINLLTDIEKQFEGAECPKVNEKIELKGQKLKNNATSECGCGDNRFWIIDSKNIWIVLGSSCACNVLENDLNNITYDGESGIGFRLDYSKDLEDKIKEYVSLN